MSSTGFVNQGYRDMVKWQWYRDPIVRSLFEHLLRIVNENDKMELGICIKSGSVLITISEIAYTIGFTVKQIRVAMDKLISSHDVSIKSIHAKGTIITIEEWHKYQLKINDNLADGNRRATEGQQQVIDNNNLTELEAFQRATEGQQNTEIAIQNQPKGNRRATEGQQQNADIQEDTNVIENKRATEGQQQDQPKESENRETSPETLKENKEEENTNSKEINNNINIIKKEKFFEDEPEKKADEKPEEKTEEKTNERQKTTDNVALKKKPVYTISFSFEKSIFEGITDKDIELWRKAYPAIDVGNEILKAACWLAANPKNAKSNYKKFLNNWFSRAQDHARPGQQLLQFPSQMSYGERKRLQAGPDVSQVPGFIGKEIDFDKDAPDNPF